MEARSAELRASAGRRGRSPKEGAYRQCSASPRSARSLRCTGQTAAQRTYPAAVKRGRIWVIGAIGVVIVCVVALGVRWALDSREQGSEVGTVSGASTSTIQSPSPVPSILPTAEEVATDGAAGEALDVSPRYKITELETVVPCGADPTAIQLKDKIRVYYAPGGSSCPGFPNDEPDSVVVPLDGGKARVDEGIRFSTSGYAGPHKRILALPDGRYRMYFHTPLGEPNAGIGSAISSDGLNFEPEPGLRITAKEAGFGPGYELSPGDIVPTGDGRYRMYFSSLTPLIGDVSWQTIKSAVSTDLLEWEVEEGDRIGGSATISGGEHPSAVLNPDGSVTLFYGRNVNYALFYSTSKDGLTFEKEDRLVHSVVDSAFIPQPDGTLIGFIGRRDNYGTGISYIVRVLLTPTGPEDPQPSPSATVLSAPLTLAEACARIQQSVDSIIAVKGDATEPGQYRTFAAAMSTLAGQSGEAARPLVESLATISRATSTGLAQATDRDKSNARVAWLDEWGRVANACGQQGVLISLP